MQYLLQEFLYFQLLYSENMTIIQKVILNNIIITIGKSDGFLVIEQIFIQ